MSKTLRITRETSKGGSKSGIKEIELDGVSAGYTCNERDGPKGVSSAGSRG